MIETFTIPSLDEQELQAKLSDVRYPNEFVDNEVGWTCGTPSWAVKRMVEAWKTSYSWEKAREEMNRWHHYKTKIEDLNIHFVHEPSTGDNAIPIILMSGWPSTFYEFHKVIEPLRDSTTQPFHVVAPSLPGFGFSEAPKHKGAGGIPQIANIMNQLMLRLGYDKYMIFGSDWGAFIGNYMAEHYSDHCIGYITSMPVAPPPWPTLTNLISDPMKVIWFVLAIFLGFDKIYGKEDTKGLLTGAFANVEKCESAGYRAIQGTRPYSLAYGLTDSPVGLLGWMLEKYHDWTDMTAMDDPNAHLLPSSITTDEFLTQVTIYWITNTMSSSCRLYYEELNTLMNPKNKSKKTNSTDTATKSVKKAVPTAVSVFMHEIVKFPRDWVQATFNLVQYNKHPKGGHFPALEVPDLLVNDLQEFGLKISHDQRQTSKKEL